MSEEKTRGLCVNKGKRIRSETETEKLISVSQVATSFTITRDSRKNMERHRISFTTGCPDYFRVSLVTHIKPRERRSFLYISLITIFPTQFVLSK